MATEEKPRLQSSAAVASSPPQGRDTVLHTRVVTETGGGPEKTILLSASFLADSDYWLAAAYMHPPDDPGFEVIRQRAAEWESPLFGVPDRGPFDLSVLWRMRSLCRRLNVRIWHAHDYKSNLIGLLLRPFHRMALVTTVHGWVGRSKRTALYYKVDRWCLPRYDHVICVSDDLHEEVLQIGVLPEKLSLVRNAIDDRTFVRRHTPPSAPFRRQRHVPEGRLLVGAVGRLMSEKGFDLLIDAVGCLVAEGHDLELWIAGDGRLRGELESLIMKQGLQDRVKLLGFVSDTIAFYEALDVFVLSSRREGLPNVVLEAASMHTPIVATRVAGIPMMLTNDADALLCEVEDRVGLLNQLRIAVTDAALRDRLANAARELIESRYSFRVRMDQVRAIYDQLR